MFSYEFVGSRLPLQSGDGPMEQEVRAAAAQVAAAALVSERFLLPGDVERVVAAALMSFEEDDPAC